MQKRKNYSLGNALKNSKSHPWGKGASYRYTSDQLVEVGHKAGYSYKELYKKLEAIANITEKSAPHVSRTWRVAAAIAHNKAY